MEVRTVTTSDRSLLHAVRSTLDQAQEAFLCVAFVQERGLHLLERELEGLQRRKAPARLLVTTTFQTTSRRLGGGPAQVWASAGGGARRYVWLKRLSGSRRRGWNSAAGPGSGEPGTDAPLPRLASVVVPVVTAMAPGLAAVKIRGFVRASGPPVHRRPRVCA